MSARRSLAERLDRECALRVKEAEQGELLQAGTVYLAPGDWHLGVQRGADGLLAMKRAGAITIAQDKESSVVHGMPGEAIALGAADFILPPPRIAELLTSFAATAYPLLP